MAAIAAATRESWPLAKFTKQIQGLSSEAKLAVLLYSGTLNPTHHGILSMFEQAKERLERAGYMVAGAWLSPRCEKKAKQGDGVELPSVEFRLRTAELVSSSSDIIAVGSWESDPSNSSGLTTGMETIEAAHALQGFLEAHLLSSKVGPVRTFVVCSPDEYKAFPKLRMAQGLVIAPMEFQEFMLEKPSQLLFVAEPPLGRVATFTCERILEAIRKGDSAFVAAAMGSEAASFVMEPTAAVRQALGPDFQLLAPTPASAGPWPAAKLAARLASAGDEQVLAVLVASGTMSPVHRGHIHLLAKAKERLERAGYAVIGGYLSPTNNFRTQMETKPGDSLQSSAFRLRAAELAVMGDDFLSVGSWEAGTCAQEERSLSALEVAEALKNDLSQRLKQSLMGRTLRVFYVGGSDVVEKHGLQRGVAAHRSLGSVMVCRGDGELLNLEAPTQLIFVAHPEPNEVSGMSSTALRKAIRSGDSTMAAAAMAPAAVRFIMGPTASERSAMAADFESLGVKVPGPREVAKSKTELKGALRSYVGPSGSIRPADIVRLLSLLDPSWTSQELEVLMAGAKVDPTGSLISDDFVDWIFTNL